MPALLVAVLHFLTANAVAIGAVAAIVTTVNEGEQAYINARAIAGQEAEQQK